MVRRLLEEVAMVISDSIETIVFIEKIYRALEQNKSDIVYFISKGKLYGVISVGDIKRSNKRYIKVNQNFTYLVGWDSFQAKKIFKKKTKINKIPVINENGYFLGDYSRWDDIRWYKRNINFVINPNLLEKDICIVDPGKRKKEMFYQVKNFFDKQEIKYIFCNCVWKDFINYFIKGIQMIFVDEDELCAIQAIYADKVDFNEIEMYTFQAFVKTCKIYNEEISILKTLQNRGIKCYTLSRRKTGSQWEKMYYKLLEERFKNVIMDDRRRIPIEFAEGFFAELYTEKYFQFISNLPFEMYCVSGVNKLKDVRSDYLNVIDGIRVTKNQPKYYEKTIYFFGPCIMIGAYVEDKYTIESFLQEKLNFYGILYKVVNCGAWNDKKVDINRIMETVFKEGDIVIVYTYDRYFDGIPDLNLHKVAEDYLIPIEWTTNILAHCNHKVNKILADEIFSMIKSELDDKNNLKGVSVVVDKQQYIKESYIKRYFETFNYKNYDQIGSIVMNCNPFTKGHRFLIEEAYKKVDFLIIFVVETDESFYNFEERFEMVRKGVEDLEYIIVVPSGRFILSQTTFPEYFIKIADENIIKNVDYDIMLFVDCIANQLHITHRFVGEEPFDKVTDEYNSAMKRILPSNGINLVEITRKEVKEGYISASKVRLYLENNEIEKAYRLLPKTTQIVLEGF